MIQCPGITLTQCVEIKKTSPKMAPFQGPTLAPLSSPVMCTRVPFDPVHSSVWYNSSHRTCDNHNCPPVPRNNETDRQTDTQKNVSLPHKKKRINHKRRERRARERREASEAFNHDARWATQSSGAPSSTHVPDRLTQSGPQVSDPISAMRPAVYYPRESVGNSTANDNSSLEFGQELGGLADPLPSLYKPAVPDPQHHTWANSSAATRAEIGPPSPTRNLAASSAGDRSRTGIIYPPFSHAVNDLTSVSRSKPPCQSQQPFDAQNFSSLRVRLPQAFHAPPDDSVVSGAVIAPQRFTAQPNAHLHGGTGVNYKQKSILTGINRKLYERLV